MANTPRQLVAIKMNEPKKGARTGPMITKDCRNVMAVCTESSAYASWINAVASVWTPPTLAPCKTRNTTKNSTEGLSAHPADEKANKTVTSTNGGLRPQQSLKGPVRNVEKAETKKNANMVKFR